MIRLVTYVICGCILSSQWSGQDYLKRKTITHAIQTTAMTNETVTNDFLIASGFAISVLQLSEDCLVEFLVSGTKKMILWCLTEKKIIIKSHNRFSHKIITSLSQSFEIPFSSYANNILFDVFFLSQYS